MTDNNPLVGDVAGVQLLGLTGNDILQDTVSGLESGDQKIVVRKDEAALSGLVNALSLEELGAAGVVLGPENQAAVLAAVEDALNDQFPPILGLPGIGSLAIALVAPILDGTKALGVGELVGLLQGVLIGPLAVALDPVLDVLAEQLLSNTLTLLQSTEVEATLTEYSFEEDRTATGNVIDPDNGITGEQGEDKVTPGTEITQVEMDGNIVLVPTGGSASINGLYGELEIHANGDYTYTANGDYAAQDKTEVFTYTISDGSTTDTADLNIVISRGEKPAGFSGKSAFSFDESDGIDLAGLEDSSEEPEEEVTDFSLSLNDVLSDESSEESVPLPAPEEESSFFAGAPEYSTADTAGYDVQPVIDPLDDLLDDNSSFI